MARPLITLLTDFGTSDHYVAAMKGVMLGICPEARFVDITHEIEAYAIAEAAYTLGQAWQCFPAGTIHLVVVDPGVGSARLPVLAESGGHRFVGPDNGVFTLPLEAEGGHRIHAVTNDKYFRTPVSQTFHGRDIFAPVAGHLALGVDPEDFGQPIDNYVRLDIFLEPVASQGGVAEGLVLKADRFGNVVTCFRSEVLEKQRLRYLEVNGVVVSKQASSYSQGPTGELFLITGSSGYIEISAKQGSAAAITGVRSGSPLRLYLQR
jgi:S-adenosylmethionine hydrolase